MSIAPKVLSGLIGGKAGLKAKMYPNGECVVYKAKTFKMEPLVGEPQYDPWALGPFLVALWGHVPAEALLGLSALGLSSLTNSDTLQDKGLTPDEAVPGVVKRYGVNGITPYGARRVRNACYLLENAVPEKFTVFSTCTVPSLPVEEMARLHERWNVVVETYRRKLRRFLQDKGLCGESVTVTEVQGKRYESTGIPVLHIHTVFNGRLANGRPAVTTKDHDLMWYGALSVALRGPVPKLSYACNLQWVKKSAESYLGKYMTKGSEAVRKIVADGFLGWLPKQWWSISASLGKRIDEQTRSIDELADWLNDAAEIESRDVWLWHRDVQIEMESGDKITIARFGKLSIRQTAQIKNYYAPNGP